VPITALNMAGFPDDQLDFEILGQIHAGSTERCEAAGCAILGGHTVRDTEIKFGLSVTGTIHPDRILTNATAKPGDVLVLTKPLGTGFVTTAAKKQKCPPDLLKAACDSMIELNKSACDVMLEVGVSAATDITGFGLAGHAMEMAQGSNVTLRIDLAKLPLFAGIDQIDVTKFRTRASKSNREYTEASTRLDGTPDPTRLEFFYDAQTSGGLLISVPAAKAEVLVKRLAEAKTPAAAVIGEVRAFEGKHLNVR
jgi:selenide,water dikinase